MPQSATKCGIGERRGREQAAINATFVFHEKQFGRLFLGLTIDFGAQMKRQIMPRVTLNLLMFWRLIE